MNRLVKSRNVLLSLKSHWRQQQNVALLTTSAQSNFINGTSTTYIEEIYKSWLSNPTSVHKSWDIYFRTGEFSSPPTLGVQQTDLASSHASIQQLLKLLESKGVTAPASQAPLPDITPSSPVETLIADHLKVYTLIRTFQIRGHKLAQLDPLEILQTDVTGEMYKDLTIEHFNFNEADMSRKFKLPPTTFIGGQESQLELRQIVDRLKQVYCNKIGLEYMYINSLEKCDWIRERFETPGIMNIPAEEQQNALKRLIRAHKFEEFLAKKYSSEKRFGLEGCEVLIPAMKTIIDSVSNAGVDTVIMGMPHRGRLNVLANVTRRALEEIFCEFDSKLEAADEVFTIFLPIILKIILLYIFNFNFPSG